MSRVVLDDAEGPHRFPRVSGDEPWTSGAGVPTGVFSPRERG